MEDWCLEPVVASCKLWHWRNIQRGSCNFWQRAVACRSPRLGGVGVVPGTIVGGAIGGVVGTFGGGYLGTLSVDKVYGR